NAALLADLERDGLVASTLERLVLGLQPLQFGFHRLLIHAPSPVPTMLTGSLREGSDKSNRLAFWNHRETWPERQHGALRVFQRDRRPRFGARVPHRSSLAATTTWARPSSGSTPPASRRAAQVKLLRTSVSTLVGSALTQQRREASVGPGGAAPQLVLPDSDRLHALAPKDADDLGAPCDVPSDLAAPVRRVLHRQRALADSTVNSPRKVIRSSLRKVIHLPG